MINESSIPRFGSVFRCLFSVPRIRTNVDRHGEFILRFLFDFNEIVPLLIVHVTPRIGQRAMFDARPSVN